MSGKIVGWAIGVAVFLFLLAPNQDEHRSAITEDVAGMNPGAQALATMFVAWSDLGYYNLGFVTLTGSKRRNTWVTVGILNNVFILDPEWVETLGYAPTPKNTD